MEFPNAPSISDKILATPWGEQLWARAECKTGGEIFAVERTLIPKRSPPESDFAYRYGKHLLNRMPGVLRSEERIDISEIGGYRWILEDQENTRLMEVRAVSLGREFYLFTYERPTGESVSRAAKAFFSKIGDKKG